MSLRKANMICRFAHLHGFEAVLELDGVVRISDDDGEVFVQSLSEAKYWMGY